MRTAIITVGLQFGDEGKGATVDFLCRKFGASLVVRYSGGPQCAHNVQDPDGRRHTFAMFGSGTLVGAATYLDRNVIIDPFAMENEAEHLAELGVSNPYSTLSVHPGCLVATPYHVALNRLSETLRGDARHGSCGRGVGETRRYWLEHGGDAITANDLQSRELWHKLELLRLRLQSEAGKLGIRTDGESHRYHDTLDMSSRELAQELAVASERLRLEKYPAPATAVIFEGAQGVLLDENVGFPPHTTWSDVTLRHAMEMVKDERFDRYAVVGCLRAFTTRHGAGPLPSFRKSLTDRLVDAGNPENRWQGALRTGLLDMPLLRYASASAGGRIHGLSVSWLDAYASVQQVCSSYTHGPNLDGDWRKTEESQSFIGHQLRHTDIIPRSATEAELMERLSVIAPVVIKGRGPTANDRVLEGLTFEELP